MARSDAQKWYDPGAGDPQSRYITPSDAKFAIAQIYEDMGHIVKIGDGTNGVAGHLYTPDPYYKDVNPATFTGLNPIGWIDHGDMGSIGAGGGASDHGALTGLEDDDHPQYLTQARGDARYTLASQGGGGGTAASSRLVPLIIFNGESNSGGYAENGHASAGELAPRPCVQILDNTGLASFQDLDIGTNNLVGHAGLPANASHGWELGLANSVEAGEWWSDTVYLVKTGQGASKIGDWETTDPYWLTFLDRVRAARNLLDAMGLVPVIYVWYTLGINDAIAGTNEPSWIAEVEAFHQRVHDELGPCPILMTDFMSGSAGANYNDSVQAYADEHPWVWMVTTEGATLRDTNHWDYAGMKLIASRMAAASRSYGQLEGWLMRTMALVNGSKPPTTEQPTKPSIVRTPTAVTFVEGQTGQFSVKLSQAPAANVTVSVTASGGNVTPDKASLTFTTTNWGTNQTVTLSSPDDGVDNADRSSTVTLASADVVASVTVSVTITDAGAPVGPSAPTNSALPTISGSVGEGDTLTCSTGSWNHTPTSYAYQWKRDGADIAGQTASTHVVVAADIGTTLTCTVTATNATGSNSATTSGLLIPEPSNAQPVIWTDMQNTTSPSAGTIQSANASAPMGAVGATIDLTQPFVIEAEFAAAADAMMIMIDGDSTPYFNWTTDQDYILGMYHYTGKMHVSRSYSDTTELATGAVYPMKMKMEKSGNDIIVSRQNSGQSYQVMHTETGILAGLTVGYLKALMAVPANGLSAYVTVDAGAAGPTAPLNIALPVISGITTEGSQLTCSTGTWTQSPDSYTYQWTRNGTNIGGATNSTYTVAAADIGNSIACKVTATNAQGSTTATAAAVTGAGTSSAVPVTWTDFTQTTSPAAGVLQVNGSTMPAGGNGDQIDLTQPWKVIVYHAANAETNGLVVMIDDEKSTNFSWSSQTGFLGCVYHASGTLHAGVNGTTPIPIGPATFPAVYEFEKSGNDIILRKQGGATLHTYTGALVGKTQGWVRGLFAIASGGQKVKVETET